MECIILMQFKRWPLMVVTMTARLTWTRLLFLYTQKRTPWEEGAHADPAQIHPTQREENPSGSTSVKLFWKTTMLLTPTVGFYTLLCILYLICSTGVSTCEEKFWMCKACIGVWLCVTQKPLKCGLDCTKLNQERSIYVWKLNGLGRYSFRWGFDFII